MKKLLFLIIVLFAGYVVNAQETRKSEKMTLNENKLKEIESLKGPVLHVDAKFKIKETSTNSTGQSSEIVVSNGFKNGESINLYGVRIYDDVNTAWSIVNFESGTPATVNDIVEVNLINVSNNTTRSGEFANGYLYLVNGYYFSGYGWISVDLVQISTVDWTVTNTTALSALCGDMAYDATTSTMFALSTVQLVDESYVSKIITINLTTAEFADVATLDRNFAVLACSPTGQLYGVDETGYFCSIDKVSGTVNQIGNTGFVPYYTESMGFDPVSGRLFWALADEDDNGKLIEINISTGVGTDLGTIGGNAEIVAFFSNTFVETLSPVADAQEVAVDASVFAAFNRNITAGTLTNVAISPDPGNVVASIVDNQLNITHDDFDYNTEYTITISASAITELTYDVVWTFKTELDPSACNDPTDLGASNIEFDQVTLSWTENGPATEWYIKYGATGFDVETAGTLIDQDVTNPYTLEDLTASTGYDFYVKSICGTSEESEWVGPYTFTTAVDCSVAITFPFTENFESDSYLCWTAINNSTTNTLDIRETPHEGTYSWRFSSYNTASDYNQYLITPELPTSTSNLRVSFYYAPHTSSYSIETFRVGYSTTTNDISAFIWEDEQTVTGSSTLTYSQYATVVPAGTKYITIHYMSNYKYYLYIDDISIVEFSGIVDAEVLSITEPVSGINLSDSEIVKAIIKNSGSDAISNFSIKLEVDGTLVDTETYTESIASFEQAEYTFTATADLSAAGDHTIKVTVILEDDAIATNNSVEVTVTNTVCQAISTFPWTEGFEGEVFPPSCWTMIDNDGDGMNWFSYNFTGSAHTGTKSAASASWVNPSALTPDNYLITPQLSIPSASNLELTYWVAAQDPDALGDHYEVMISTTGTNPSDFTSVFEETLNSTTWENRIISLVSYAGQTIYIAFVHNECTDKFYIKIDDVKVDYKVGITPALTDNEVSVYPNPSNGQVNVLVSEKSTVQVYDVTGKLIETHNVNAGSEVSFTQSAGMYFVKVENNNGVSTHKVIIE
ncbi:MAG: choice-of-anchor J domain-containing protein [Bacteroidales bacterium]|jgi:hypothetical protein|nr:choice-of-anchor J domain-containing protein [Bacteroidales bacterium]